MMEDFNNFVEEPEPEFYQPVLSEPESEMSETCAKTLEKLKKQWPKTPTLPFSKFVTGQNKANVCKSFMEILQLKRRNLIQVGQKSDMNDR